MDWPLYAGLSAVGALVLGAAVALWLRNGESVFADRLLSAIAGCF
ncbi:hypothetical protein [Roseibium aestuarii]|uniref:Uncharacterized protein n=1 Tax=Roseibium aestuarii TaxID=2600299 RepID=A0ABW4JUF3_9HYPH|nr:hypothetical protein [Roseibium aestuarii]